MFISLSELLPLLCLAIGVVAADSGDHFPVTAGQIRLFTDGETIPNQLGHDPLSFNVGGVSPGQTFLRFERNLKGQGPFLLADYSIWQGRKTIGADADNKDEAEMKHEEDLKKLKAGEGAFSLHKKVGEKDEHLDCRLGGDFKDPSKGVYWAFTWESTS
ncbi:uncharacterized protein MKK02DRAFT_30582 [Dioszegia hungarica]|uniref:Uncharacterized protein n=1 Tax=Dioszegia hungarica TaxID=4972 RepID=A0AA38H5E4_9TREE|nr:uncharacterized protein MKK02DRAFT_30582 [Dioszegia hungarica]KAI9632854.1 hypothetical protein MKK02DRAFT_30582 [Dioszegia hungarica]